ncbi:MAG: phenylacetate--CoA ligase family protein, partial [Gammaproteobacteria bacterium]
MLDREFEIREPREQFRIDRELYARQIDYLFQRSAFYRRKLGEAGFQDRRSVGTLEDISNLPFTEKDELRTTQADHPPFGDHLACEPEDLVRIYSTSGTTGVPCFLGVTQHDLEMYATNVARGYT